MTHTRTYMYAYVCMVVHTQALMAVYPVTWLPLWCLLFQVYGETSYDLVEQVVKEANVTENDVFLDLGSGE